MNSENAPRTPNEPTTSAQVAWRDYSDNPWTPVLGAALRCFARAGYHGTSIRSIAQEAKLSVPGLYHHWPSKQAILQALLSQGMDELWWRTELAREAGGSDPLAQFNNVMDCMLWFHTVRRDESLVNVSETRALEPDGLVAHRAKRVRQQQQIDQIVVAGAEAGVFSSQFPLDASRAVVSMCVSVAQWFRPDGELSAAEVVERYTELCLRTVGAKVADGR